MPRVEFEGNADVVMVRASDAITLEGFCPEFAQKVRDKVAMAARGRPVWLAVAGDSLIIGHGGHHRSNWWNDAQRKAEESL